jgi:hypothetical protein
MTSLIITLLVISQIITFIIIFKRIKPTVIKPNGILLKPISVDLNYEDLDPDFNTVFDVLESIKLEGWELEFEKEIFCRFLN